MELNDIFTFDDDYQRGVVLLEATQDWNWPLTDAAQEWWGEYVDIAYEGRMLQMGDYSEIPFPLVFSQDSGQQFKDVLGIEWGNVFVVSDKFREVLEKNHFTGWKCYPVRVFDKSGQEKEGYQGLSITGRAGKIYWDRCEKVHKPESNNNRIYYKGLPLDISEWDGSDFFLAKGCFDNFVTRNVHDALLEAGLTSLRFEKVTDVLTSEEDVDRHRDI